MGLRTSAKSKLKEAESFWLKFPRKSYHGTHNTNVSGDYVYESKNAYDMYQVRYVENGRYCQFITLPAAKDIYDLTEWGAGVELVLDSITVGEESRNVKYCVSTWSGAGDAEYCNFAPSCRNVFGCVNLKKKQYCILNKQYSQEEYEKLREKIIEDMNQNPYRDSQGREWKYGEFLPYDLSPFAYNESHAAQYFPLTKEEVQKSGWQWQDQKPSSHTVTLPPEKLPDNIADTSDSITSEVLKCAECGRAYRIIFGEFTFLKRFSLPIPDTCSDCRHMRRMRRTNPPKLWTRNCGKCDAEIKTSYAPDRPELVYCEQCYQFEIA